MESGVLNRENLSSVLRSISQRRRQGVLEINEAGEQTQILFYQGKIVEVVKGESSPAVEVAQLLEAAELISVPESFRPRSYLELFDQLNSLVLGDPVDEALLKRAIKHRVLNCVYDLSDLSGAYYTLKVQIVEYERDFAPVISVGQILLDLVALSNEGARFAEMFSPRTFIRPAQSSEGGLSEEEALLLEIIGEGINFAVLQRKAMLSRYHLQDACLSLLDRSLLAVAAAGDGEEAAARPAGKEVLTSIDRSIDQAFAEEAKLVKAERSFAQAQDAKAAPAAQTQSAARQPEESLAQAELPAVPGWRLSLIKASSQLSEGWLVPGVLAVIFLLGAAVIPFFAWRSAIEYFGR